MIWSRPADPFLISSLLIGSRSLGGDSPHSFMRILHQLRRSCSRRVQPVVSNPPISWIWTWTTAGPGDSTVDGAIWLARGAMYLRYRTYALPSTREQQ